MITIRRSGTASAATLIVLALGLTQIIAPGWIRRVGLDTWNMGTVMALARETTAQADLLKEQQEKLRRQIEAASLVSAQLAAGNLSLVEAIQEVSPILEDRLGFGINTSSEYLPKSYEQRVGRYLIRHATKQLLVSPVEMALCLARLEAEFAHLSKS